MGDYPVSPLDAHARAGSSYHPSCPLLRPHLHISSLRLGQSKVEGIWLTDSGRPPRLVSRHLAQVAQATTSRESESDIPVASTSSASSPQQSAPSQLQSSARERLVPSRQPQPQSVADSPSPASLPANVTIASTTRDGSIASASFTGNRRQMRPLATTEASLAVGDAPPSQSTAAHAGEWIQVGSSRAAAPSTSRAPEPKKSFGFGAFDQAQAPGKINPLNGQIHSPAYKGMHELRQRLRVRCDIRHVLDFLADTEKRILLLSAQPGAGLSTQVPQAAVHEQHYNSTSKEVLFVTSSVLARDCLAKRIAFEMDVVVGKDVLTGRKSSPGHVAARLRVVDYDDFFHLFADSPTLDAHKIVILDDLHLRTALMDLTLSALRRLVDRNRNDLKLIAMSTGGDMNPLRSFFPSASRYGFVKDASKSCMTYVESMKDMEDYLYGALQLLSAALAQKPGKDVVIFFASRQEILDAEQYFAAQLRIDKAKYKVYVLHEQLSIREQLEVVNAVNGNTRGGLVRTSSVILATSLAENGISLGPNLESVIDSMFTLESSMSPVSTAQRQLVVPVSRATAERRAGLIPHAVKDGAVYRLCLAEHFATQLEAHPTPAILREDFTWSLLRLVRLRSLAEGDKLEYGICEPSGQHLLRAIQQNRLLGTLNTELGLTPLGERITDLPVMPILGKILLESQRFGCTRNACDLVAVLAKGDVMFRTPSLRDTLVSLVPTKLRHVDSDALSLMNGFNFFANLPASHPAWAANPSISFAGCAEVRALRDDLIASLSGMDLSLTYKVPRSVDYFDDMVKTVLSGMFVNMAMARTEESTARRSWVRYAETEAPVQLSQDSAVVPSSQFVVYLRGIDTGVGSMTLDTVTLVKSQTLHEVIQLVSGLRVK